MNKTTSFSIWYVLLAIMAVVLVHDFILALNKVEELPYSQFKNLVVTGKVAEVSVTSHILTGK
ncbi:MAG: ATP-dependent metallopeptidase FtsH/Yme1/Tma family protein, partial [Nitrospira sp.]|nr:ATP-dependent metallopeptidase FtsH/Yme1/Tma family protein [Nitrospira sp.]